MTTYFTRVKNKVTSWFNPQKLDVEKFRGVILGTTVTITIAEVAAYKLLIQNVKHGDLPESITDILIIAISVFEALISPFISWYGYRNCRRTLTAWVVALVVTAFTWFALPSISETADAFSCFKTFTFVAFTPSALIRLSILTASCLVFSLTRVAVLTHGIAHLNQNSPDKISLHYGLCLIFRILPLFLADKIATKSIENNTDTGMTGLLVGSIISLYQITTSVPNPETAEKQTVRKKESSTEGSVEESQTESELTGEAEEQRPEENVTEERSSEGDKNLEDFKRDFWPSLKRVLTNKLLIFQTVAMGFLAAALWGFGYHHDDIIKAKYYIDPRRDPNNNVLELFRLYFVVIVVLYAATFYYPPIVKKELLKKANNISIVMAGIACVIYIVIVHYEDCPKGIIAGMDFDTYYTMGCGADRCTPLWREFSPVCVPDTMLTFLSAREAGCSHPFEINGIALFVNCTCSGTSQFALATEGACSDGICNPVYQFHLMLFLAIVIATALSLQAQGILILRSVDPRDSSVALGIASSVVAIITFGGAHVFYNIIRTTTCLWFEEDRCHLQDVLFPSVVGEVSGLLAFLSVALSLLAWFTRDRAKDYDDIASDKKIK